MKSALALATLFSLAGPLALGAQGIPAAPAALATDSLARAASAAAAANTVAINFVWTLITCRPASPWWRPGSRAPRTRPTRSP